MSAERDDRVITLITSSTASMIQLRAGLLATLIALPVAPLAAQICNGTATFAYGPVRVGGFAQIGDGSRIIEGQAALGRGNAGLFGGLGIRHTEYAGAGSNTRAGHVGYSIPLHGSQRVQVCPVLAANITRGPRFEIAVGLDEETMASRNAGIGFGLGAQVVNRATFDLVPFISAAYYRHVQDVTYQALTSTTHFQTYDFAAGAGFVVDKQLTLRPSVAFSLRDGVTAPIYGLALTFAIPGGKPRGN